MPTPKIGRRLDKEEAVDVKVEVTPEEAADLLLQYLPADVRGPLLSVAESIPLKPWKLMLGYLIRYVSMGRHLYNPAVLDAWEEGRRPDDPHPCRSCGEMFKSRFPDAAHCCNPCVAGKLTTLGHADTCPTRSLAGV